jgi:hypothetical protein
MAKPPSPAEQERAVKKAAAEAAPEPVPVVVRLADVEPERIEWLWDGYLPLGKVVVLDGDPGVGKSTVSLDIAARVTTGSPMPDGSPGTKGAVLVLSAEDGLADTIRPRLDAAAADPASVITITEIGAGEYARPVSIPGDLPAVETVIKDNDVRLVIVDVLMAYLSGDVNAHRDQDIRRALHRLAGLAERARCCVIVLRHLNKSGGPNALYRGGGSIGIIGAARAGLLVAADPDDLKRRLLAVTECNLTAPPRPLRFALEPWDGVCRVAWLGGAEYEADELVGRVSPAERAEREAVRCMLDEATAFLRDLLATGPKPRSMCYLLGQAAGYSRRTLERAVQALRVVRRFGRRSAGGEATYQLPPTPGPAGVGELASEP